MMEKKKGLLNLASTKTALSIPHYIYILQCIFKVPASRLLVPDKQIGVRFWHDQLFAKPAKHGGVVAW